MESSFDKAELKFRSENPPQNPKTNKKCIPLVVDFNPGLPDCNKIINKHKHILDLDLSLPFNSDNLLTSYRKAKTVKDLLVSSRLRPIEDSRDGVEGKCSPCENKCTVCKTFLVETNKFTSHHTSQTFYINQKVNCNSENVIYLINIKKCKLSYIGYTTTAMKSRWSTTKSHIRKGVENCEICTHIINCKAHDSIIRYPSIKTYDETLKNEVELIIIEQVRVPPGSSTEVKEKLCQVREGYWQTRLRTMTRYGGSMY